MITAYNKLDTRRIPERVNLSEAVKEVIHHNRLRIEADQVIVKTSGKENLPIQSNRQQLIIALDNILLNSFQAMADVADSKMSITWTTTRDKLILTIKDNGYGISKENQPQIFDLFFSTKQDSGGSGMGLSTAREIIEMYGGSITVSSAEGRGTKFEITFMLIEEIQQEDVFQKADD